MTDKQKRFCDEYLIDCNAARAYKVAYPTIKREESARACGSRLLTNANVKAYIEEQQEKLRSEKVADAREVLEYFTAVVRGETLSEIVVVEGTGEGCSRARRMEKAPDEKEKLKAAEYLAKFHGILTPGGALQYGTQKPEDDPLTRSLREEAERLDHADQ